MNVPARVAEGPIFRSAAEWREIVEDFEREGTTAVAYCEGRGLKPKTLLRRKRANYDVGTLSDFAGFSLRRAVRKRGTGLRFRGPRSSDRRRTDPSIFSA